MSKYLSREQFLSAITGAERDIEIPGVGSVRLRPLTVEEVSQLQVKYGDDSVGMSIEAVVYALVEPKLSPEDAETLRQASIGTFTLLAQEVLESSGMGDAEELAKKVGVGS